MCVRLRVLDKQGREGWVGGGWKATLGADRVIRDGVLEDQRSLKHESHRGAADDLLKLKDKMRTRTRIAAPARSMEHDSQRLSVCGMGANSRILLASMQEEVVQGCSTALDGARS